MTSSQVVLVAVTSSLVTVFAMLLVASVRRARPRVPMPPAKPREEPPVEAPEPEITPKKPTARKKPTAKKTAARKTTKTTRKRT